MSSSLTDPFGRQIRYLRVSVTDQCDLRCNYCMPQAYRDFTVPSEWLTFDEITRIVQSFVRLGTQHVRLTGGEPLVRKDLPSLVTQLKALDGISDISLSTNATRLDKLAQPLYEAGIQRVNVSLDTLNADRFKAITQGKLDKVLRGLAAAKQAGLSPIKINMVVMKGVNDNEVTDIVEYCIENGFTLRFIETMPMGASGLTATQQYMNLTEVKQHIEQHYTLHPSHMQGAGPARYYNISGSDLHIGFITPISQHFCETCNRVRLAVDGTLYMCLGQDYSYPLRDLLRQGISDTELDTHIQTAIKLKPKQHEFNDKPQQIIRMMSQTGG